MKQKDNVIKFKTVDLGNGINVGIVDARDGKIVEINVSGQKKKLPLTDIDPLVNALMLAKQWLIDNKQVSV
jgi:hypothetical protein